MERAKVGVEAQWRTEGQGGLASATARLEIQVVEDVSSEAAARGRNVPKSTWHRQTLISFLRDSRLPGFGCQRGTVVTFDAALCVQYVRLNHGWQTVVARS